MLYKCGMSRYNALQRAVFGLQGSWLEVRKPEIPSLKIFSAGAQGAAQAPPLSGEHVIGLHNLVKEC